jgi:hypothetical protein
MAYFNHAFQKMFLGTKTENPAVNIDNGFLFDDEGTATSTLYDTYGTGVFGFADQNNGWTLVDSGSTAVVTGKPLTLVSTALYQHDKVGKFHGGYQETNKSKMINPKYVSRFYRVDPCAPTQHIVHIGKTPYTIDQETANCCHDFYCDETYYLRLDVKGSPVLRYLTRNAYWTADYYTGCCPPDDCNPTTCEQKQKVDPTYVMIGWATGLLGQGTYGAANYVPNVIVGPFIKIVITGWDGTQWVQPGTDATGYDGTWDEYVSTFDPTTDSCDNATNGAGMTIIGCYVDTRFGDCTFYPSDFFQKEPVKIYASEVDMLGDPCVYTGICVVTECEPRQGMGFGEQVLRDLILSESYSQNYFATNWDLRIREITQGYDISSAVDRTALYTRYYIQHSVPRFNNPTGTFDNDQYLLCIPTEAQSAAFETFMAAWLSACNCNATLEEYACEYSCSPFSAGDICGNPTP